MPATAGSMRKMAAASALTASGDASMTSLENRMLTGLRRDTTPVVWPVTIVLQACWAAASGPSAVVPRPQPASNIGRATSIAAIAPTETQDFIARMNINLR